MVFTTRCYAERDIATVKSSVRLSVCNVEVSRSHRLEFFENNSRLVRLACFNPRGIPRNFARYRVGVWEKWLST